MKKIKGKFFALAFLFFWVLLGLGLASTVQADISFALAVNYGVGGIYPLSVAVGDFNGDGKPDLAVAYESSCYVSILLGNGDGTFAAAVNYFVNCGGSVAVGDFNGDGKLDLAVANTNTSGTVSILLGNGDGTFAPAVNYSVGIWPVFVAVGDFNGDGKPDLAVANYDSKTVSILLGNGDGTFQAKVDYGVGTSPYSVAVGDFNGDCKPDLAVANWGSNTVSILLGNGDGTFAPAVNYSVGTTPTSIAVGDFNGDGKLDLAVTNYYSKTVSILLNTGDGTFPPMMSAAPGVGTYPVSVAVGDFNGDGKPDLAVANQVSNNISILLNTTAINTCTITAAAGCGGIITLNGSSYVNFGDSRIAIITASTGYHILDVVVDGVSQGAIISYPFNNVTVNHTISASFAINTYTITATAGANGSISPSGSVTLNYGGSRNFSITPNTVYHVADVLVDGNSVGAVASYEFTNVTTNHTITASFAINTYTITVTAGANGSISPPGITTVNYGANQTYNISPNPGYHVADVLVDGVSVGAVTSYQFNNVTANHTISASFALYSVVTLLAPLGGEILPSGSNFTIKWGGPSTATKFNIFYSDNNGVTWQKLYAGATGYSYSWTVPTPANNKKCKVKVVGLTAANAVVGSATSNTFTLEVVRLTAPNGGESWKSGITHNLTWLTNATKAAVAKVVLSYTKDGGITWSTITTITGSNPGTYSWAPTYVTTNKTNCKVKVVLKDAVGHIVGSDISNVKFTLTP